MAKDTPQACPQAWGRDGCSQNLRKRFWQYYNINYLTDNTGMIICRALLKYGYSSFSLAILEYCKVEDLSPSGDEREEYYFKSLGPEYNVCKEAGKPRNTSGLEVSIFVGSAPKMEPKFP